MRMPISVWRELIADTGTMSAMIALKGTTVSTNHQNQQFVLVAFTALRRPQLVRRAQQVATVLRAA